MALKDWEKRFSGFWINKKNSDSLQIGEVEERVNNKSVSRDFSVHLNSNAIKRGFKTKSKALKFALRYMKNH